MSLRHEQYRSLLSTRQFLFDLLDSSKRPKAVKAVKERAAQCLKHFPMLCEDGMPVFSKDEDGLPNSSALSVCVACGHELDKHDDLGCKQILKWTRFNESVSATEVPVFCNCHAKPNK